ncbi:MAG: ATP-binding cassette domain-containing protein [Planctomycetota bacterium]
MIPLLEVESVSAGYGGDTILKEVSLSLESGDVIGLVGRNGSGKSTFLHTIVGLTQISHGSIRFRGHEIHRLKPRQILAKGIAYASQKDAIFPELSVVENLDISILLTGSRGANSRQEREEALLNFPSLQKFRYSPAKALSGGMQKILSLAMALQQNPHFLMLDEPSVGLDKRALVQIEEQINNLKVNGAGLIIVEHNQDFLRSVANTILTVDDGMI